MDPLIEEIERLKKEKDAVVMAHYYVPDEVQEIADYIGDSFYLSKVATQVEAKTVVFAGVSFMGESAKILNPDKTVLLPDETADCPMAHMASQEKIEKMREKYPDLAVVCYINSTARLKTYADVCVTSANAVKIVKALPNQNIYFIPDQNLGSYVAAQVPEKHVMVNDGYCPIHKGILAEQVLEAKAAHPQAKFLVHPECTQDVLKLADMVGSTSKIIDFASKSQEREFIIGTEKGVFYELQKKNPDKIFYPVGCGQFCLDMKKITLQKVRDSLKYGRHAVEVDEDVSRQAKLPLEKMLELGK
ncbi:MAG: quinolinate synthase NadA [Blautia sp.]|jgi:quinolinate synthase